MKTLKGVKLDDVNNFSGIVDSLMTYIKKYWKCDVAPKGYKEFCDDYDDYEGMEELDEEKLEKEFKGFADSSACSFSFPIKMSLPYIAYDDLGQGRDPLNGLVSNVLAHGLIVGQKRGELRGLKALKNLKSAIIYEIAIAKERKCEVDMEGITRAFEFFEDFNQV